VDFDLDAVKAGFRLGPEYGDTLTYAQVRERREIIRKRMQERPRKQ